MDEKNIHLEHFGKIVRETRLKEIPKMSQITFYRFILPNINNSNENIKKKMNSIENGRGKTIDFEFLDAFTSKYNYSYDYVFGLKPDYKSYTNEFLCNYFGLAEDSIEALHQIALDKNNNICGPVYVKTRDELNKKMCDLPKVRAATEFAITFTSLLDFIFMKDEEMDIKQSIFSYIYNYCASDAKILSPENHRLDYNAQKNQLPYLIDSDNTLYGISATDLYLEAQIKKLTDTLDKLRQIYKQSNLHRPRIPQVLSYSLVHD